MSDFVLSCCSTADMPIEFYKERLIEYVCFHYEINGESYPDDLGNSIPFETFYNRMAQGEITKTSQVNSEEYIEYFDKFLSEGKDILHLSLSSGISGTVNSAYIAKAELEDKYPGRKIYIVDSLCASGGFGLLMDCLATRRDEGYTIDELYRYAEEYRNNIQHWFFTTDLTYLIRGGRVSKVSGYIGNMLNICPLLNVNIEGKLIPRFKIRTKRKVISATVDQLIQHADKGADYDGKVFINHASCYEDAKAVADLIEERIPNTKGKISINWIGTTIGSHTGPGTVAVFFCGDKREL